VMALLQHGKLEKRQGRFGIAMQTYSSAVAMHPDSNAAYYNLGKTTVGVGEIFLAVSNYLSALHIETHNALHNPKWKEQHARSLAALSMDIKNDLQRVHPRALDLLLDAYTVCHLGHAVVIQASLGVLNDTNYQSYFKSYQAAARGELPGWQMPPSEFVYHLKVGVMFAADNIHWNGLDTVDIYERYTYSDRWRYDRFS